MMMYTVVVVKRLLMTFVSKCMHVLFTLQWRCDENRHTSDVVVVFLVLVVSYDTVVKSWFSGC